MARPKTIRELLVAVGVRADTKRLALFDQQLGKVKTGMATVARGGVIVTAAFLGVTAAAFRFTQATADAGDAAAKTGKRIGLTAAEVQELSFAAEISGANVSDLEAGMRRLTKTASDADRGLKTATDAFGDLQIGVKDSAGELKAPLVLFEEVAQALSEVENDTKRAALAAEIFGRGGARLIPLLTEGADGIQALREEARELGFVFDGEAAEAAEKFIDAQTRSRKVLEGLRNTIGIALMPVFTDMLEGFRDWFVANREVIKQRLERTAERIAEGLRDVGRVIVRVDRFVRERVGGWERVLTGVLTVIGLLVGLKGFASIVTILQAVGAGFSILAGVGLAAMGQIAAIVAAVVAGVGLLFLAVDDLIVFMRGGESVIGAFFERFDRGNQVLPRIQELFDSTATSGDRLLSVLMRLAMVAGRILRPVLELLQPVLEGVGQALAFLVGVEIDRQISRLEDWIGVFDNLALTLDRVAAAIDRFLLKGKGAADVLRGLLEVRSAILSGTFGDTGAALITGAGQAALGIRGPLPGGFTPGGGGGNTTNAPVTVQGDTITINGTSSSPDEIRAIFAERDREKRRATAAALSGGEL